jgi:diaminopimelate epimerase
VDMGAPVLYPWSTALRQPLHPTTTNTDDITDTTTASATATGSASAAGVPFPLQLVHSQYMVTDISMGNPHAVVFVENLKEFVSTVFPDEGSKLSHCFEVFPEGTNAEFAQVRHSCLVLSSLSICLSVCLFLHVRSDL